VAAHSPVFPGADVKGNGGGANLGGGKDVLSLAADIALGVRLGVHMRQADPALAHARVETTWQGFSASLNERQRHALNEMLAKSPPSAGARGRRGRQPSTKHVPAYIKGALSSFLTNQTPSRAQRPHQEGDDDDTDEQDSEQDSRHESGQPMREERLQTPTIQNDVQMLLDGVARLHQEVLASSDSPRYLGASSDSPRYLGRTIEP